VWLAGENSWDDHTD